jgi:hypothetical protein
MMYVELEEVRHTYTVFSVHQQEMESTLSLTCLSNRHSQCSGSRSRLSM